MAETIVTELRRTGAGVLEATPTVLRWSSAARTGARGEEHRQVRQRRRQPLQHVHLTLLLGRVGLASGYYPLRELATRQRALDVPTQFGDRRQSHDFPLQLHTPLAMSLLSRPHTLLERCMSLLQARQFFRDAP